MFVVILNFCCQLGLHGHRGLYKRRVY
jgi:hypothetical protein